jgi:hypothetical protein
VTPRMHRVGSFDACVVSRVAAKAAERAL